jgi:hypothetical protein
VDIEISMRAGESALAATPATIFRNYFAPFGDRLG